MAECWLWLPALEGRGGGRGGGREEAEAVMGFSADCGNGSESLPSNGIPVRALTLQRGAELEFSGRISPITRLRERQEKNTRGYATAIICMWL